MQTLTEQSHAVMIDSFLSSSSSTPARTRVGCCFTTLAFPVPPPDGRLLQSITAVAQKERTGEHARLDTGAELGGRLDHFFPDLIYFIYRSARQIWYYGKDERSDAKSVHVRGLENPRICKLSLGVINQPGIFPFVYWFLYVVSIF